MRSTLVLRNVVANNKRTTVRFEPEFWDALDEIARERGVSKSAIVREVQDRNTGPLTSAIRVYILTYYRNKEGAQNGARSWQHKE